MYDNKKKPGWDLHRLAIHFSLYQVTHARTIIQSSESQRRSSEQWPPAKCVWVFNTQLPDSEGDNRTFPYLVLTFITLNGQPKPRDTLGARNFHCQNWTSALRITKGLELERQKKPATGSVQANSL